ncbi:MAG: hypothetical protein RLN76_03710 [Phycisphaeraceae bacterium]
MLLAYVDVRPLFYLAGLLVVVILPAILILCSQTRLKKPRLITLLFLAYTSLFAFLLYGPLIHYQETQTHPMTWEIVDPPTRYTRETQIRLRFVQSPSYQMTHHNTELAQHLLQLDQETVPVTFSVSKAYFFFYGGHSVLAIADQRVTMTRFDSFGSRFTQRDSTIPKTSDFPFY